MTCPPKPVQSEGAPTLARSGGFASPHASMTFRNYSPLAAALLGLAVGVIAPVLGGQATGRAALALTTAVILVAAAASSARRLLRRELGVDVIAILAMAGALLLRQYLAGAIIAVMLTGGAALERYAIERARGELSALIRRAPRLAHQRHGESFVDVPVDEVAIGDVLVVKSGEVVPVDGIVSAGSAVLDESSLTGESRPVKLETGTPVRSGGSNAGSPFELRVAATAASSTYAGIIRLVQAAEQSKAPFVRLADRYALAFLALTLAAAAAAWIFGGSPMRALAVLVVATPCPLILAAPAAIVAGVSRAARRGIIMKGGAPLEALARVRVLLLDKTGTVTSARPEVIAAEAFGSFSSRELIRSAASIEQLSVHPFAPAIVVEAHDRGLDLPFPSEVTEQTGSGIRGRVEGHLVAVGQRDFVAPGGERGPEVRAIEQRSAVEGSSTVYVAIDGSLAGIVLLQDPIRPEAPRAMRQLRRAGIERIHLLTGDHPDVAELVGDALGVDRVYAERAPEEKVEVLRLVRAEGVTAMVGDGINDAPALALADVGIAMGARGATAASEAADVVLTSDRFEGVAEAIMIARRTHRIARESVFAGMGLSLLAMMFAAVGAITPIPGALLQEVIDVLVILNALRALTGPAPVVSGKPALGELARELAASHRTLRPLIGELAGVAVRLETLPPAVARAQLQRLQEMLETELLPHESEEQRTAYPLIESMLRDENPTGPLIQTHHEIRRLSRLFQRLVAQLPAVGPAREDLRDLRRVLYGLHAILTLHFAQEDELYSLFAG
jgi:heavy metal translocating P-type ATPase